MDVYLDIIVSFATLTILEIVLGVDNLVFLAIISRKLPQHQRATARRIGLCLALVMRLLLLASAVWIIKLTYPLITLFGNEFSGKDLFLLAGGMFLLTKATQEIHNELDPVPHKKTEIKPRASFGGVVFQIAMLDIVFSLDSILTAIGLTTRYALMVIAIVIAMGCMLFMSETLSRFIEKHPTIRMLALCFLILIGMVLVADGLEFHFPRGYLYFAMGFSLFIEFLNMLRKKRVGVN